MSVAGVLNYVVTVSIGIAAALLIRRVYLRGSGRVRAGLTAGTSLVVGVAVLIVMFGR
jgi:hypothetical protein